MYENPLLERAILFVPLAVCFLFLGFQFSSPLAILGAVVALLPIPNYGRKKEFKGTRCPMLGEAARRGAEIKPQEQPARTPPQ